ncbi:unnamed protein product [Brachionus calyciflorus]|uniref:G-protein coupled receptors family 1 profile domain-containing protein n=1 Tax=Brachionus calyciflorus TaxID=104777 RepID=A0A814DHI6_9BILA|nr:unnamed protein product [Brachionus calyciflorus]
MYNNTTSRFIDKYSLESPVECYKLKIVGVYCIILFVFSTFFNGALLWAFIKNKSLRTSINIFIIALAVFNLFGTLVELPFIILSNLNCKWIFGEFACVFSAYIMYFIGCTSIYLMAAISFERFYIIYKPLSIRNVNKKNNLVIIFLCSLNGLMWATFPLIGWSHYSLEGAMTSCAVEWKERSTNVSSYNITIFSVVYLIPFLLILISNTKLIFIVKSLPNKMKMSQDTQARKRVASERYLTIILIIIILVFVVSWTPYAMVSMYSAFIDEEGVSPLAGTLPAVIAKSSMLWTALIYVFSNRNIRSSLVASLKLKFPNSDLSQSRNKTNQNSLSNQNQPIQGNESSKL